MHPWQLCCHQLAGIPPPPVLTLTEDEIEQADHRMRTPLGSFTCIDCGTDHQQTSHQHKRCAECTVIIRAKRDKERKRAYRARKAAAKCQ